MKKLNLNGKVAIVTGASKGIGREVAATLSREGMHVALVARDAALLANLQAELERTAGRALAISRDLRAADAPMSCVEETLKAFGQLDLVVNNAGDTKRGDFFELTDEDWARGFGLKFFGYVRMTRAAWPHLRKTRGSIVNIIGNNSRAGHAIFTIGGATNAALVNFTKSMADRGNADGVRVNAINPGVIVTERFDNRLDFVARESKVTREQAADIIREQSRISRFGRPEEIADMVAYLASERAGFIQGAIIDIDGGQNRAV
jgi:NAD(P)-dependent dehydrogenase (short-subunit alcohol dehydrogenase family)